MSACGLRVVLVRLRPEVIQRWTGCNVDANVDADNGDAPLDANHKPPPPPKHRYYTRSQVMDRDPDLMPVDGDAPLDANHQPPPPPPKHRYHTRSQVINPDPDLMPIDKGTMGHPYPPSNASSGEMWCPQSDDSSGEEWEHIDDGVVRTRPPARRFRARKEPGKKVAGPASDETALPTTATNPTLLDPDARGKNSPSSSEGSFCPPNSALKSVPVEFVSEDELEVHEDTENDGSVSLAKSKLYFETSESGSEADTEPLEASEDGEELGNDSESDMIDVSDLTDSEEYDPDDVDKSLSF